MPDIPTRLDLHAIGRTHVLTHATKIDPAQVDVAGSDVNIVVASSSYMAYQVALQLSQGLGSLMLDAATGDDLDRFVMDRYEIPRKGAQAALVDVRFFRDSLAAGLGFVPMETKLVTLTGIEYVTTETAVFGATDSEVTVQARAVEAGKATQVGRNSIRRIDKPQLLWEPKLQVTNDEPASGGEDREDDNMYRERARAFYLTARRGTISAIELGAKSVGGIVSADASEVIGLDGNPARVVQLFVADSSGIANAPLAASAIANLEEYRAAGIAVLPVLSIPQIVAVNLRLLFTVGADTATLSMNVRNAVVTFINSLGVNQPLYYADLSAVLRRFKQFGLVPDENTIVTPPGDVYPLAGRTLRTRTENVTLV